MISSVFKTIWKYASVFVSSIVEGQRLRTQMMMQMYGVKFDSKGNVITHPPIGR